MHEKFTVFEEKLSGDGLNIKSAFYLIQSWGLFIICQNIEQTALGGVAFLVGAHEKRPTPGRSEFFLHLHSAGFGLFKFVIHFDQ